MGYSKIPLKFAALVLTFFCLSSATSFAKNFSPATGTVSPNNSLSKPEITVNFTTTYSDANGYPDIQYASFLINTSTSPKKCFYGYYNQNTKKLYIRDDTNTTWIGGFAPGSGNIIENSFAKLVCSKTTVSGSNTSLTITWSVVFKPTFIGSKNIYLKVADNSNASTAWVKKGTWTISLNPPPTINSITPVDDSVFLAGAKIDIQINATDLYNDSLEYQFSIGGKVKQVWSTSRFYTWQTTASDKGYVNITCEVRDNGGARVFKTITYSIINPTTQQILQKVASNYALIRDKKMDVTMTSKFNNENFGQTIYTRHYFKKPSKQRTDTFSSQDGAEASKTETQIILGADTYLIDPISHVKASRNILKELKITQKQLYQMDEIYSLSLFLSAHKIIRKDNIEDLTRGLVTIEVVPKAASNIYSKLELQIDYFKGIKTKSLTCFKEDDQDKLKQAIVITDTQKMPNGTWVPKAQVKTLYLKNDNLVMTYNFENIQINTGLSDYLFDPKRQ